MAEDDLDLVLHLGDYIYEDGAGAGVRKHLGRRSARWPTTAPARAVPADPHLQRRARPLSRGSSPGTTTRFDNNYAGGHRGRRRDAPAVPGAAGQRLPGVLREHAAAAARRCRAARTCSSTAGSLRAAGRVPRARHPPVPHRPAERRRPQGALRRGATTRRAR